MNSTNSKSIVIDLDIGDQLTSISCGHVVVELIKFIAYQRLQIPYKYQWLKQIVTKKKFCDDHNKRDSFHSERHFHVASSALENLDFILKSLLQEINSSSVPDEVCIALGGSPLTCKEMYRLLLPTTCHKPQCHSTYIATDQKIQQSVFKTLVTSDKLGQMFYNPLPPTNTHVFIKKKTMNHQVIPPNIENFSLTSGCRIPKSTKIVVIDFRTRKQENISCCNDFKVFGELKGHNLKNLQIEDKGNCDQQEYDLNEIESSDAMKWYQSAYVMKGFKDCIVNGSSVTNEWLEMTQPDSMLI